MAQASADGMSPSTMTPETYQFPSDRLRRQLKEPGKTPLVLVACGSCKFSGSRRSHHLALSRNSWELWELTMGDVVPASSLADYVSALEDVPHGGGLLQAFE